MRNLNYLIFCGNTNGYNDDKGVMADFTAPYCLWNIGISTNLDDGYFLYSVRKDGSTPGSLIIMSGTGNFDAYNNSEGYTDRFSNVFRFTEVEGEVVGLRNLNTAYSSEIYDLNGRRHNQKSGICISNGQKYIR